MATSAMICRSGLVASFVLGAVIVTVSSCSGDSQPGVSFSESMRAHGATGSRTVIDLHSLPAAGSTSAPVFVSGDIVAVRADRGWVNLPEDEIHGDTDVREVEFESSTADFRTILVTLDVDELLRDGSGIDGADVRHAVETGGTVDLTLVLYNDTTLASTRAELIGFGDVIVPLVASDRGAFGWVVTPHSGYDMIIDVDPDGTVTMPLAEPAVADAVLGDARTEADVLALLADSP